MAMQSSEPRIYRIVTRSSQLAVAQTNLVASLLRAAHPQLAAEQLVIQQMTTVGDQRTDVPLSQIGTQGVFTKELERELYNNTADIAVHSLKDLPTVISPGLVIAALPNRASRGDVLVLNAKHKGATIETLPEGSLIGSSSLRRVAMMRNRFPHLRFQDIRGNLNTRLRKLDEGQYDAIILAAAGMERLGWHDRIDQRLSEATYLYAPGQGSLAVECRADDAETVALLQAINDPAVYTACLAERTLLRTLEGGCRVPIAVYSEALADSSQIKLVGQVWSEDGVRTVRSELTGASDDPEALGRNLAESMLGLGARGILRDIMANFEENAFGFSRKK